MNTVHEQFGEGGLRATVITHVDFEDLGSLEPELVRAGYSVMTVNACNSDLKSPLLRDNDLLIVLGGPIGVYERESYPFLEAELDLIRMRLSRKQRTLGICLGAQLIAAAAGAAVYPGAQGSEIGWKTIHAGRDAALYSEFSELLAPGLRLLHWHGDTFDMPRGAHHLAATDVYPNQAFAIERHALALQFHPEVIFRGLERWYVGHACELGKANISVRQLRRESEIYAPALEIAARRFLRQWLARS
ncbi:MAG: glutamine amidotransferase [Acidobacteriaceae bacterium]